MAGHPRAAAALRAARARLAARALEIAIDRDPSFSQRYDETGLRRLLNDAQVLLDQVAEAIASNDPHVVGGWAEWLAPIYRRRGVPMDDLVQIAEGIRLAGSATLAPEELASLDAAVDEGVRVFRWHRRLAGDARRRNRILAAIYKGA
jgi:hypothetical protein